MKDIKVVIKPFFGLLIMVACILLVMHAFFSMDYAGGRGTFEVGGQIFKQAVSSDETKNDGISYIGGTSAGDVPVVTYVSGAQQAGTNLIFKGLFSVKKSNGTTVNGTAEDDFAIYLMDIKTLEGESVLETLSTAEIENLGEIPAPFIYDKATDRLYLYSGGVYIVQVKIYGNSGGQQIYEFRLPVETM